MFLRIFILLTSFFFSITLYADCTPVEVSNVNLAKDAADQGAIGEAWQYIDNVSDSCYLEELVLEKTLAVFNRVCNLQFQQITSHFFSFLYHSQSTFLLCDRGLFVLNQVESKRPLSQSEMTLRRSFALGTGAGILQNLPRQGTVNFCSQKEVPDYSISGILISTQHFVKSGPSQVSFLNEYYKQAQALLTMIPFSNNLTSLHDMRSYLQSEESGIGACQSPWWNCCP